MRKIWVALLVLTALVSVVFFIKTGLQLKEYFSLNTVSKALVMDWKIVEKAEASFALSVEYRFHTQKEENYQGKIELAKPYFLNLPSAQNAIKEFSKKSWDVFYNNKDPSINSLQKNFPFKDCIQSLLTLGVFIYFIFFKKIMEKSTQEW